MGPVLGQHFSQAVEGMADSVTFTTRTAKCTFFEALPLTDQPEGGKIATVELADILLLEIKALSLLLFALL